MTYGGYLRAYINIVGESDVPQPVPRTLEQPEKWGGGGDGGWGCLWRDWRRFVRESVLTLVIIDCELFPWYAMIRWSVSENGSQDVGLHPKVVIYASKDSSGYRLAAVPTGQTDLEPAETERE